MSRNGSSKEFSPVLEIQELVGLVAPDANLPDMYSMNKPIFIAIGRFPSCFSMPSLDMFPLQIKWLPKGT